MTGRNLPIGVGFGVLALVCAAAPGRAADGVETVVVTASPPDPVGNEAFSVIKVTPSQLRGKASLDAALKQVPGLSLFRRDTSINANPTTQGVSLRSIAPSGAGRALVTLDGVPQNDPFGNWVIWSSIPAEDLGGAEIVRGAGAGPYGSGALTGTIALEEASGEGLVAADAAGGSGGLFRAAGAGGFDVDRFQVFASASAISSHGWIPVSRDQRGAADDALTLDARNVSLRVQSFADADTLISARVGAYHEDRNSGLVDAGSSADGVTGSLTVAHPQERGGYGWRAQLWVRDVGLTNTSVAIGTNRASTTQTNNQYDVPATGWGGNAALRGSWGWLDWEAGTDARFAEGESRELYSTGLSMRRISGGRSSVAGVYVEGAARAHGWLFTLGARVDQWQTANGHLTESDVATGAITKHEVYPSRSGTLPTARAGLRRELGDGFYVRGAAYEGFRAPSLNELYRPFRVGQITTLANPALVPEKLYGTEIGIGQDTDRFHWSATLFWNRLHDAIANVTIGNNQQMRENAGDIDAYGVEAEARYDLTHNLSLRAALNGVDASLNGNRPAQAPRWTATGGLDYRPLDRLTLTADVRFESRRFADDLNTIPLAAATTVDTRASWALTQSLSAFVYCENIFNAHVASTAASQPVDGGVNAIVTTYSAPRIVGAGISFTQ